MVPRTGLCCAVARHAQARWKLTRREEELLGVLLQGKDNDAIAATLGCRPRTVEAHVTKMLLKSACASRLDLACTAWAGWAASSTTRGKNPTIAHDGGSGRGPIASASEATRRLAGRTRIVETTYVPAPIADKHGRPVGSRP